MTIPRLRGRHQHKNIFIFRLRLGYSINFEVIGILRIFERNTIIWYGTIVPHIGLWLPK